MHDVYKCPNGCVEQTRPGVCPKCGSVLTPVDKAEVSRKPA